MYPEQVKKHLWNDLEEVSKNAVRNLIEFAAENFDWKQAVEDNQFLISPSSGKKVHPAHLHWLDYITVQPKQHQQQQQSNFWKLQQAFDFDG
jgi:hypothetical protein